MPILSCIKQSTVRLIILAGIGIGALFAAHRVHATVSEPITALTCLPQYTGHTGESLPWLIPSQPTDNARAALEAIDNAESHGLDPVQYRAMDLVFRARRLMNTDFSDRNPLPGELESIARFNRDLTQAVTCYLQQVRNGQLEPELVQAGVMLRPSYWQSAPALRIAWDSGRISQLLRTAPPPGIQYQQLRSALAHYRAVLERKFSSLSTSSDDSVNSTPVAPADSIDRKIVKIELALERLRWVPRASTGKIIEVNIPEFAMRLTSQGQLLQSSLVAVGRAGQTATPIYAGPVAKIVFNPIWYVPHSIAKRQILPRLRRDARYLQRQKMVIVDRNGKRSSRVTKYLLDQIAKGQARIEQRAGPENALGKVKFVLPNDRAIYIHDTNRPEVFTQNDRAQSNGCVWVDDAIDLATQLLSDDPSWPSRRITQLLKSGNTQSISSVGSTIVVFNYQTAIANGQGQAQFFPDVYGHDAAVIAMVPRWAANWRVDSTPQKIAQN